MYTSGPVQNDYRVCDVGITIRCLFIDPVLNSWQFKAGSKQLVISIDLISIIANLLASSLHQWCNKYLRL